MRAAAHPLSIDSTDYAARPHGLRTLQWLHSFGPAACQWNTCEIAREALSAGAYGIVAWLCFDANLISVDDVAVEEALIDSVYRRDAERCLQLYSKFGVKPLLRDATKHLVERSQGRIWRFDVFTGLVSHDLFAVEELEAPWGEWTSQDCRKIALRFPTSRASSENNRKAWRRLHRSTCPCTCSPSDIPDACIYL